MKIIVLDSTAKSIKAVLASSVATSNPDFVVAYADTSDNTFSELSSDGQLNGTTDVTLVSAPASGVKRAIKSITIYNRDTAAVTVSIKFDNGGTQRILQRVQLVSGETWHSDELTKLSPGGSDTQVQFNDLGTLAGSSNFTYNKTTSVLTLGANPVLSAGTANGVLYLNGSKVATSGSALVFDGATQFINATNTAYRGQLSLNGGASGIAQLTLYQGSTTQTNLVGQLYSLTDQVTLAASRASGYITMEVNGSEAMRLTSTSLYTASGINVGIGTSSPSVRLQVEGAANSAPLTLLRLNNSGTTAGGPGIASRISFTAGATALGYIQGSNFASGAAGLQFSGDGTNAQATLDSSGNLGLGVTPSAWGSGGNLVLSGSFTSNGINLVSGTNFYVSGTNKYIGTGAATQYQQYSGAHYWFTAPSGTANTAITSFTQAMTLDASGRLLLGGTTAYSTAKSQLVNGDNDIGANNYAQTSLQYINGGYSHFIASRHDAAGTTDGNAITYYLNNSTTAGGSTAPGTGNVLAYFMGGLTHRWYTNGSERARITSGGNLLLKDTNDVTVTGPSGAIISALSVGGSFIISVAFSVASPYTQNIQIDITWANWGSNNVIGLVDLMAQTRQWANTSGAAFGKVFATNTSGAATFSTFNTTNITTSQCTLTAASGGNYTLRLTIDPTNNMDAAGVYLTIPRGISVLPTTVAISLV